MITPAQRLYIRRHYRQYSDGQLAKALDLPKGLVAAYLKAKRLQRSREDLAPARESDTPPEYTGQIARPEGFTPLRASHVLTALVAALAALAVYWTNLPPTVTGEDSGELVTAAYTLGIPHPPGYPTWVLATHPFTWLPFGSVAWRVALASAVYSAAAVACVALLVMKLTGSRIAGLAGGLALAFSREFWEQGVIAEVYGLNSFFVALSLLLLIVWYGNRRNGPLLAFAAIYGISLGNHNTTMLLGPLFVLFVLSVDWEPWRRWRLYLGCTGLALAMLAVYAYLPIRSLANPPVDWGNPETLQNFWDVVTRKQYAFALQQEARTPLRFLHQSWAYLGEYALQFTPWVAWIPAVGAVALWRRSRLMCVFLALVFVAMSFGFVFITNFEITKRDLWVNGVFWIPSYIVAATLLGVALGSLAKVRLRAIPLAPVAAIVAAVAVALPAWRHYGANDKSDYYFAYDYASNVLKTLPEDAIYLPAADHATFPVIYLQAVEGIRPDVAIGNKYGYPEESLYEDMPQSIRRHFSRIPNDSQDRQIENWIIQNTDRPVCFTEKRPPDGLAGRALVTEGLVFRVASLDAPPSDRDYWSEYTWHTLDEDDARGEFSAELILSDYWFARGRSRLAAGETDAAIAAFDVSVRAGDYTKEAYNNVATACAEAQQFDYAAEYYLGALQDDPDYPVALRNLGQVYLQAGNYPDAYEQFDRLGAIGKSTRQDVLLTIDCLAGLERADEALDMLQSMIREHPEDPELFKKAGMVYLNQKHQMEIAQVYFQQAFALDPNQPDLLALLQGAEGAKGANAPEEPTFPTPPGLDIPGLDMTGMNLPQAPMPQLPSLPGQP